jgi:dTDP-4-amino-4,6-dideoxy-D-galactose acyltransferase
MSTHDTLEDKLFRLLDLKAGGLTCYSPFSFLRAVDPEVLLTDTFIKPLRKDISEDGSVITEIEDSGCLTYFVWKVLPWDSAYFSRKVIRIELILPDHDSIHTLSRAVSRFIDDFSGNDDYIVFTVPCEDMTMIQGLSSTPFKLVETRLNYYFNAFREADPPTVPVRRAGTKDIPALREVAMTMRNRFDRIHADPAFSPETADAYLGTFTEEAVKGFADMVIVPDLPGAEPFGFLAANHPERVAGLNIAKLVLAAVDNSKYRGWLFHLLAGVISELKEKDTDILTTITQASNRPAIRTWEKAGFRLGFVTHVYSYSKK